MVPLALHFQALFKKSVSIVPALLLACCVRWSREFAECFGFDIELRGIVSKGSNLPLVII